MSAAAAMRLTQVHGKPNWTPRRASARPRQGVVTGGGQREAGGIRCLPVFLAHNVPHAVVEASGLRP
jgi:hypothetical protein